MLRFIIHVPVPRAVIEVVAYLFPVHAAHYIRSPASGEGDRDGANGGAHFNERCAGEV
jgi:hypothetical protein